MSYLLDKKAKRNKFLSGIIVLIILVVFIYFSSDIFKGFSFTSHAIFRPVLVLGNNISEKLKSVSSFLYFKKTLLKENENLKLELSETKNGMLNYDSVFNENIIMKEILGRKIVQDDLVLASVLSGSNQSIYDTLFVDVGGNLGINVGDLVFAKGNLAIGRVAEVYPNSSKVILFSTPGVDTEVLIPISGEQAGVTSRDVFMNLIGRGGGNFEMILLRDFNLKKGTEVVLPGITPYVVGLVETIISDPRDSFQKALVVSPVNMREIKFVQIKRP